MTGAVALIAVAAFVGIAVLLRFQNRRNAALDQDDPGGDGREAEQAHT